jgi:hypothetical protein
MYLIKIQSTCPQEDVPPLGVIPQKYWLEDHPASSLELLEYRYGQVNGAIKRRLPTKFNIPQIWLEERAELVNKIAQEKRWAYDPLNLNKKLYRLLIATCYTFVIKLENLEKRL